MEYFNAGGGGAAGNGAGDPYAVIPQQFGNGGQQQPQQNVYPEYQPEGGVVDYETYQQQQQYRGNQQSQPSPSLYYQAQMNQANYFPIHSASEHDYLTDFLGPQQPAAGTAVTSPQNATPYQGRSGANKEFMIQHQQRRGNQSGSQQSQNTQQSGQQGQQNQSGRQQNQQQMQQQQQNSQQSHFLHQQMQAAQQQQAQQLQHRLHGAPINAQQFMVPPPTMIQSQQMQQAQQQQVHQMHQMQQMHQQQHQHHPQMIQQQQAQQAYHPAQSNQQQTGGHHQQQHNQSQNHHHQSQNHPGPHHIPQNQMMPPRVMFKLRDWPIRCVVESKYQPVIYGENHSTIREIAQTCHCRVEFVTLSKKERISLGNNTDRILTIHGHAEQASKAVARILDVIQTEALKDDAMVGADVVLRLRAHNQLCGRLIGKNGNSIKDLMQKTGTHITVTKFVEVPVQVGEPLRNGEMLGIQERTIVIKGPSIEAVVQAESLISAKLKKCYESDTQLRAQNVQMPVMMPPLPPPITPMISGAQLIPTPTGMMQIQHFTRSPHHQLTQNNSYLAPGILQMGAGIFNLRQVRVWVPDNMIGALIGAKGKNIKMIIRDTGAIVKIEAPEEKAQREAEEAEKKQKKAEEAENEENDGAAAGDHPQEFLEDNGTVTSSDAIEEKPKPVSERTVTITGDDLQLMKAQTFVFTKIAETGAPAPVNPMEQLPILTLKLRTEVCVPTKIIGRIIGKGGQNVRELQRITGASVKIPEEERNGSTTFTHEDGVVEEMTLIRVTGNMYSTHNVQFRLGHLINEFYRGEQLHKSAGRSGRPQSAPGKDGSGRDKMDQLGQVPPLSNNASRTSPKTGSTPKSKSP